MFYLIFLQIVDGRSRNGIFHFGFLIGCRMDLYVAKLLTLTRLVLEYRVRVWGLNRMPRGYMNCWEKKCAGNIMQNLHVCKPDQDILI